MNSYESLAELPVFAGISEETILDMERGGGASVMRRGTFCFRAAEKQEQIWILLQGQAISYNLTSGGCRKIIFVHGGGELLNESVLPAERTTLYCELLQDSLVFRMPAAAFCQLMERDFSLTRAVMRIQERKLRRLSHQLKNTLGSIYLDKKLAAKLWKLARDFGTPAGEPARLHGPVRIQMKLSITFLADLLGAPRETTSRVCKNLTERGLIVMEKKYVTVCDMDALAAFYKKDS